METFRFHLGTYQSTSTCQPGTKKIALLVLFAVGIVYKALRCNNYNQESGYKLLVRVLYLSAYTTYLT